jgi:hypothetical protein
MVTHAWDYTYIFAMVADACPEATVRLVQTWYGVVSWLGFITFLSSVGSRNNSFRLLFHDSGHFFVDSTYTVTLTRNVECCMFLRERSSLDIDQCLKYRLYLQCFCLHLQLERGKDSRESTHSVGSVKQSYFLSLLLVA